MNPLWISSVLGLTSSFTHCAGMCGPIAYSLSKHFGAKGSTYYHIGRITGYSLIGTLVGLFSSSLTFIEDPFYKRIAMTSLAVLYLVFAFSFLAKKNYLEKFLHKLFPQQQYQNYLRKKKQLWLLPAGLVGSMLPCPTTLAALGYSLYLQNPILSGLNMAFFGLSTLPFFIVMNLKPFRKPLFLNAWMPRIFAFFFIFLSYQKLNAAWFTETLSCH